MLASGTLQEVLDSFDGAIARTATPQRRRGLAWRRGRDYHEYWPNVADVPVDAVAVNPDLEDVVIALSLLRGHVREVAS
jgi:ABC-2 type transport system ATP-binding protein